MDSIGRRDFVHAVGAVAGAAWAGQGVTPHVASAQTPAAGRGSTSAGGSPRGTAPSPSPTPVVGLPPDDTVYLTGDGLNLSPAAYATVLEQLTRAANVSEDTYLLGGDIETFEREWAERLGKEMAVFMPSGTLANHLALRALAGTRRRVLLQDTSHVYNDTGDACQTLSGLTLMPLAPGKATLTRGEVEAALARTASGRVAAEVGAISIESPVRRLAGQLVDWSEVEAVAALARERGIGMHLDGARLLIASAYTSMTPAQYAAPFDTVYVSLWKYFNSGIGAILAGPRRVLDGMYHTRRMFGGNLAVGWPAALVSRHYQQGFDARFKAAIRSSEELFAALATRPAFAVERVSNGTNLSRIVVKGKDPAEVRRRLGSARIVLPPSSTGTFTVAVNETWTRRSTGDLLAAFDAAVA